MTNHEAMSIDEAIKRVADLSQFIPAPDRWDDIIDQLVQFGCTYVDGRRGMVVIGCYFNV